jgi:hypothetical protein
MPGRVEQINIAKELEAKLEPVSAVDALAGQGLRGDRSPRAASARTSTRPSDSDVSSMRTTASAPSGTTAPVEMRIASPSPTARSAG